MNLQRHLQNVADNRRRELIPYVFHYTNGIVQTGPFSGMTITPESMWGDGDVVGKLLGVYEDELHEFIESAIVKSPDIVLNIGAAEGYYSVGLARRLPNAKVIAIDIDPRSTNIIEKNSKSNNIYNIKPVTEFVNSAWIETQCSKYVTPLLVVDCEVAELSLLDLTTAPSLKNASIIVESHDCIVPGITETLVQRFNQTHAIAIAKQTGKNPYQFNFLNPLSDCDKWALVHEGRPSTMSWLYMVPNK